MCLLNSNLHIFCLLTTAPGYLTDTKIQYDQNWAHCLSSLHNKSCFPFHISCSVKDTTIQSEPSHVSGIIFSSLFLSPLINWPLLVNCYQLQSKGGRYYMQKNPITLKFLSSSVVSFLIALLILL